MSRDRTLTGSASTRAASTPAASNPSRYSRSTDGSGSRAARSTRSPVLRRALTYRAHDITENSGAIMLPSGGARCAFREILSAMKDPSAMPEIANLDGALADCGAARCIRDRILLALVLYALV